MYVHSYCFSPGTCVDIMVLDYIYIWKFATLEEIEVLEEQHTA